MKIGFIGIGKLGLVCAETIAFKDHDVTGYDIETRSSSFVKFKNSRVRC